MPLINCKVELKLRWTKHCVLTVTANGNNNSNPDRIIFTIKNTKLYSLFVTLSEIDNQELLKLLSRSFERSVYWNEYKTKSENKNTTNDYIYFLESNFVRVNRLFVLICPNKKNSIKRFKAKKYYLPKGILRNYNIIINGKDFYEQLINSDIKRDEELKKTTCQGEDYTTECLLNYEYIKNHYMVITVDLSRRKELDFDPKAIQQTEFIGQLKKLDDNGNATDAGNDQSMFVLTILEKIKETRLKLFLRKRNSIIEDDKFSRSQS